MSMVDAAPGPTPDDARDDCVADDLVEGAVAGDASAPPLPGLAATLAATGRRTQRREHVVGSVLLARLAQWGLWLLVIAAVAMAAFAIVAATSRPEPRRVLPGTDRRSTVEGDAVLVAGFAQLVVRRYLGQAGEGAEDLMTPVLAGDAPDLRGVTPEGFYVLDAATVAVDDRGGGYWAATVAAELMAAVERRYEPIGVRYYSVGVFTGAADGPVLADLPSQIPAPEAAELPGLVAEPLATPDHDSPHVTAVREFLGALLLGQGAIQRYTAPGTDISAIDPAPFRALEIDGAAVVDPTAAATPVRVSVLAVGEEGLAQRLHYTVRLRERAGRWEVEELFAAPPLVDGGGADG